MSVSGEDYLPTYQSQGGPVCWGLEMRKDGGGSTGMWERERGVDRGHIGEVVGERLEEFSELTGT